MTALRSFGTAVCAVLLFVAAAPSCTATVAVSDLWMSPDDDGGRRRRDFFTDTKQINCIAEVAISRDNATLEMLIRRTQSFDFTKNDFVNVDTITTYMEQRPEVTKGRANVLLQVPHTTANAQSGQQDDTDAPYVPGLLQCEVRLDGDIKKVATFKIDFPPCPTAQIQAGTVCLGFYRIGEVCPQSGATGAPEPTCKCGDKGWEC